MFHVNTLWFFLYLGIGLTSWLLTNSLFIEVPSFAQTLPEGYAIASQMSLVIQFTNFFALIYVFFYDYIKISQKILILALQICSIGTALAIAFCWDIIWSNHSILLLIFSGLSGLVGCMSVVIFYPFASKSSPFLTSAISLGMGLTGLISSLLGIIQTIYSISVQNYFIFNALILVYSLLSFLVVIYLSKRRDNSTPTELSKIDDCLINSNIQDKEFIDDEDNKSENFEITEIQKLSKSSHFLIASQLINCFIYYLLLGVVPYAVDEFENSSNLLSVMYIWGMTFGSIGRFLCTFAFFRSKSQILVISCLLIQYILGIFILIQCFFHVIDSYWIWSVIISYIIFSGINGYEDTLLYQIAAIIQSDVRNIEKITRYIGLSNQAGAFCGSILSFMLIEFGWIN